MIARGAMQDGQRDWLTSTLFWLTDAQMA